MDLKSFIGATHEHTFQYYKQDPETGGYEEHLSKGATFTTLSPKQCQVGHLAEGGWQYANIPFSYWGGAGWNHILVPKLNPVVVIDDLHLKVGGVNYPNFAFSHGLYRYWEELNISVIGWVNKTSGYMSNLDKEGYPRDPVPRNYQREGWVEQFMWQMGMSRSRYKPTFAERFPHVGNTRLYPRGERFISEF